MDNNVSGQHISQVVAPLLAAFTLPTIAVIVVTPPPHWRYAILSLFVASAGLRHEYLALASRPPQVVAALTADRDISDVQLAGSRAAGRARSQTGTSR
jgi:hypothetical protein